MPFTRMQLLFNTGLILTEGNCYVISLFFCFHLAGDIIRSACGFKKMQGAAAGCANFTNVTFSQYV